MVVRGQYSPLDVEGPAFADAWVTDTVEGLETFCTAIVRAVFILIFFLSRPEGSSSSLRFPAMIELDVFSVKNKGLSWV